MHSAEKTACVQPLAAYRIIHNILNIIHDVPHIKHDSQAVDKPTLHSPGGIQIIFWREGIRMRQGSKEHLDADQEVLEAGRDFIFVKILLLVALLILAPCVPLQAQTSVQ